MPRPIWFVAGFLAVAAVHAETAPTVDFALLQDLPDCANTCLADWAQEQLEATGDNEVKCPMNPEELDGNKATQCVLKNCSVLDSLAAREIVSNACHYPIRDKSRTFYIASIVFTVLSTVFVAQRFAVKIIDINLDIGWDDYLTLLAAVLQLPGTVIGCGPGIASGLGKDIWTLSSEQITSFGYWLYVYTTMYFTNITLCKLAFLFFYLRVFPSTQVRRVLWATAIFVAVWGFTFMLVSIFQCSPINYYWLRWDAEHEGRCVNSSHVAWANGAISIALDFWMIGIPLSQLNALNLTWRKKIGVGAMFCVGLFVTIVSIFRLHSLVENGWDSPNATWVKFDVALWSTIEVNVGIICACMPSVRSLLVRIFPRMSVLSSDPRSRIDITERNLGFGTTSRTMAERNPGVLLPTRPNAIALHTSYAVEYEPRESDEDERKLMTDLKWLRSSGSSPSGRNTSRSPSSKSSQRL